MNKNATTQLHIYSAFFVLAGFVLNRGVFLLFLAEKGMSVTQIALYQALFNIATVVLELPTGLIGDFFGKKFSIQVGVLLLFFHTAGMLLLSGPFLVVLSLVEALAYSLQSGSEQALLYEIARNAGQGERFLTINARLLAAQPSLREWQLCSDLSLPKYLGAPSTYVSPFSISCSFSFCIPLRGRKRPVLKALKREGLTQPRCSDAKPGALENPHLRYCSSSSAQACSTDSTVVITT